MKKYGLIIISSLLLFAFSSCSVFKKGSKCDCPSWGKSSSKHKI